jgi:hypothetical protein
MPQEPMELEVKSLKSFEIKNEKKGEVEAVIVTLNVVDRDHDIVRPGAIPDGVRVKLSDYGHSVAFGAPPVGKGVLRTKGDKVVFQGHYFMDTERGAEAFRLMKSIGEDDQEWSFGFVVTGDELPAREERQKGAWRILTKLDSFEVSPVVRGAGVGTRTVSLKAAGASGPPEPEPLDGEAPPEIAEGEPAPEPTPETAPKLPDAEPEPATAPAEDPAEAKAAEDAARLKLQAEIDAEVERFQRTRRLFNS